MIRAGRREELFGMYENPYQKYKEEAVMTMTKGEMLLLLYDELLKRLTAAELTVKKQDYDAFNTHVGRAGDIIQYLRDTLNFDYPISRQLYQMYDFFQVELGRIRASRNPEQIAEVKKLVQELREAFAEAEKKVSQ